VLALVGGALGAALALLVRDHFATVSAHAMGMPEVRVAMDIPTIARGAAFELCVTLVATALPVLRLLRLPVQRVIRESPASAAAAPALRGVASFVRRLPVSYRYALRDLARQRFRTAVTVTSIALALGVATAYRLSFVSLETTLSDWLEQDRWSLSIDFLYPVLIERVPELARLPGVARIEPYLSCSVQAHAGGNVSDVTLVGLDASSRLVNVNVVQGRRFRAGVEREAVLTRELARRLGLRVGDAFELEALNRRYPARLVGLSWAAVAGLSVVPFAVAQDVCQYPDKATGAYLETSGDGTLDPSRAYEVEFVGKVLAKSSLLAQIKSVIATTVTLLDIASALSFFIAALVVLTSINLMVLENERDFGTLQALGYGRRLIATTVLTEAGLYAVGAVSLGIPVSAAISVFLNERMSAAWLQVQSAFPPWAFARVLAPALLLIPLGCYPGLRHVMSRAALASIRSRVLE
jgi:ABC-type lipoprotein release transport system permease subunit